jgi:adenylate cyclase
MRKTHVIIAGIIFCIFILAGYLNPTRAMLEALESKSMDLRFKIRGDRETSGQVVIAGIEARGIEAYGRWP